MSEEKPVEELPQTQVPATFGRLFNASLIALLGYIIGLFVSVLFLFIGTVFLMTDSTGNFVSWAQVFVGLALWLGTLIFGLWVAIRFGSYGGARLRFVRTDLREVARREAQKANSTPSKKDD